MTSKAEIELANINAVFKSLSHPTRRQILAVLKVRNGEMYANEISERFDYSWPTITRHLRQLEDAKLIKMERKGKNYLYKIDAKYLKKVVGKWIDWFDTSTKEQGK